MAEKLIRIPLAGNAFRETLGSGGKVTPGGISEWSDPDAKFGIYVSFRAGVTFHAALKLRNQTSKAKIRFAALQNDYEIALEPGYNEVPLGTYTTEKDGTSVSNCRAFQRTAPISLLRRSFFCTSRTKRTFSLLHHPEG